MSRSAHERYLLPLVLGVADGVVNALTLASGAVLRGAGLSLTLGLRVGAVAVVSALFTVFVADYAQLRAGLIRAERQLNLLESGRMATTQLGRDVRREAMTSAVLASVASFVGAFAPLLIGSLTAPYSWTALAASVAGLGTLGTGLATVVHGQRWRWTAAMTVMGVVVAVVGVALDIT